MSKKFKTAEELIAELPPVVLEELDARAERFKRTRIEELRLALERGLGICQRPGSNRMLADAEEKVQALIGARARATAFDQEAHALTDTLRALTRSVADFEAEGCPETAALYRQGLEVERGHRDYLLACAAKMRTIADL